MIDEGATDKQIADAIARNPELVNQRGELGHTGIQCAVSEGRIELAELLLESGSDPDKFCQMSPLMHAVMDENVELVKLLLKHGADPLKPGAPLDITPYSMRDSRKNPKIKQLLEDAVRMRRK